MNGQTVSRVRVPLPGGGMAIYGAGAVLLRYWHPDGMGNIRLASNPTSGFYGDMAFAPYGDTYAASSTPASIFAGLPDDTSGSLDDAMFREFDTTQGRWLSPDPAGLAAVDDTNPQSFNRYAYVLNNPLGLIDPLGLCGESDISYTDPDTGMVYVIGDSPCPIGIFIASGGSPINCYGCGKVPGGGSGGSGSGPGTQTGTTPPAKNGFTLSIRAPGQTWSQCMTANSNTYSIGGAFELGENVMTGTSTNISKTTSIITGNGITDMFFEGPGASDFLSVASHGAGSPLTFGRRTSDIMSLNLAGKGGLPYALGSTGAQEFFETAGKWLDLGLDEAEKFAVDAGLAGAESINCAVPGGHD